MMSNITHLQQFSSIKLLFSHEEYTFDYIHDTVNY